jgi:hypothetical protein
MMDRFGRRIAYCGIYPVVAIRTATKAVSSKPIPVMTIQCSFMPDRVQAYRAGGVPVMVRGLHPAEPGGPQEHHRCVSHLRRSGDDARSAIFIHLRAFFFGDFSDKHNRHAARPMVDGITTKVPSRTASRDIPLRMLWEGERKDFGKAWATHKSSYRRSARWTRRLDRLETRMSSRRLRMIASVTPAFRRFRREDMIFVQEGAGSPNQLIQRLELTVSGLEVGSPDVIQLEMLGPILVDLLSSFGLMAESQ